MAGLGFKDFQVGEVLTSADVDGYLMQQSVMRFADSGARGSALGTATGAGTALAEGMVTYLDDANAVEVYDGSAWVNVSGVWDDFTPSFTNFTPGNATVVAKTRVAGKQRDVFLHVTLGSTSSVTGIITLDHVETPASWFPASGIMGVAMLVDGGVTLYEASVQVVAAGARMVRSAAFVNATTPFTWTTGDVFQMFFSYPVD